MIGVVARDNLAPSIAANELNDDRQDSRLATDPLKKLVELIINFKHIKRLTYLKFAESNNS